jgi:hypothetical protein
LVPVPDGDTSILHEEMGNGVDNRHQSVLIKKVRYSRVISRSQRSILHTHGLCLRVSQVESSIGPSLPLRPYLEIDRRSDNRSDHLTEGKPSLEDDLENTDEDWLE